MEVATEVGTAPSRASCSDEPASRIPFQVDREVEWEACPQTPCRGDVQGPWDWARLHSPIPKSMWLRAGLVSTKEGEVLPFQVAPGRASSEAVISSSQARCQAPSSMAQNQAVVAITEGRCQEVKLEEEEVEQ